MMYTINPILSIIIPCYNSGAFLFEAIRSVEQYKGIHKYEIIIVDDGSTDRDTLSLLADLNQKGYKIIYQSNQGPAAARNTGVHNAKSEFLLFLDSDNKIVPEYIDMGIDNLLKNNETAVVYGNAIFFGDFSRKPGFQSGPFEIEKI